MTHRIPAVVFLAALLAGCGNLLGTHFGGLLGEPEDAGVEGSPGSPDATEDAVVGASSDSSDGTVGAADGASPDSSDATADAVVEASPDPPEAAINDAAPPLTCISPPTGIVGWWSGDRVFKDRVGANDGHENTSGGVPFESGEVAQGFSIGTTGWIQVPDSPSLDLTNQITIEAWISPRPPTGTGAFSGKIADKVDSNYDGYMLDVYQGNLRLSAGVGGPVVRSAVTVPTNGDFIHVAGTYDGKTLAIYKDGALQATSAWTGPIPVNTLPLFIGNGHSGQPEEHFVGIIDEVTLYDRALSDAEIAALFRAGVRGKCSPSSRGSLVDFDHDKAADYAEHDVRSGAFVVHHNAGDGSFPATTSGSACVPDGGPSTCDVLLGDFDGDGWGDLAEHNWSTGAFSVHRNLQNGKFETAVWAAGTTCVAAPSGMACDIFVGDFTGDGCADYAERDPETGTMTVHENLRSGSFAAVAYASVATNFGRGLDVFVADFTGDGWADYANHEVGSGSFTVYANAHDGGFGPSAWGSGTTCQLDLDSLSSPTPPCDILIGDMDGDGRADFMAHSPTSGRTWLHLNYGPGAGTSNNGGLATWEWSICGASCEILGHALH